MQREDYYGELLRVDGYYYYQDKDGNTLISFLYRNGILLSSRAYFSSDLDVVEQEIMYDIESLRKEKNRWGVFKIRNHEIQLEQWVSPTEGITICRRKGEIINDTTFRITEEFFSYNQQTYRVDKTWHFRRFELKPDSPNRFIP